MRVSKTVKEYISKQVNAKLKKKYATLIATEKERNEICTQINKTIYDQVATIVWNEIESAVNTYPDFLEPYRWSSYDNVRANIDYALSTPLKVIRKESVFKLMEKEADGIVEDIIVTLELGGTKADLERMLAEIDVKG